MVYCTNECKNKKCPANYKNRKKAKPLILRLFAVLKYAEVISDHNSEDGDRNENCI